MSRRHVSITALAVAFAQLACGVPGELPADVDVAPDAIVGATSRADLVSTIQLNPGSWGTWSAARYCPAGSFAVGYRMRVEKGQGSNDDTTLNAVELECMDARGNVSPVLAHDGLWGDWNESTFCSNGGYVTGGAVRFESSQGSGDDTSGNDVKLRCTNGDIQAPGGGPYGAWTGVTSCPASTSVCGISVRVESPQGDGDDTALNAVKLACCTNPAPASRLRIQERLVDGIRARTFSPDVGPAKAPLVLVEGFDIDGSYTIDKILTELPAGFIGTLADLGYSPTIVDLSTRNYESIQSNARRVGTLSDQIWADSAKLRPLKLLGASMGGLVVATTAAMKHDWSTLGEANPGWTFQVDHVTTIDSPHAGVYIPQAIFQVLSRFQSLNSTAGARFRSITSVASKQMAMIPYNSDFESTHAAWQTYYEKVLRIMRKSDMRFVAVVDGSWNGEQQNPGWTSGEQNIYWAKRSTALDVDAWLYTQPAPGGRVARIKTNWALTSTEDKTYYAYAGNWPLIENTSGGTTTTWKDIAQVLDNTAVKYPKQSFAPTWSAAGISFTTFMALPADQRASMAALEAARGPLVGSALSPFDRILRTSTNNRHASIPAALLPAFLDELRTAFAPSGETPVWTGWLNRDNPGGNGDGEHFGLFTGMPCQAPLTAECRRASDGVDWSRTGEVMRCSAAGAACNNVDQADGSCDDYEVRFACPNPASVTDWANRDDPSGSGDGEHLSLLIPEYGICAEPIGIECQTTAGVDVSASGEVVRCQANLGLECLNANQSDQFCEDYRVRFTCPAGGWWTGWLNGDVPDGVGDAEQLSVHVASGAACPRPLAAECRRRGDGLDWKLVGQSMICTAAEGGFCRNDQNGGACQDYEVRFFCPGTWTQP